jgi:putative transposase
MNWKKGNRNENDPHAWMDEILDAHIKHFMMKPPYASAAWTARQADKEIRLESKRSGRPLRDNVNTTKRNIGAHRIYDLLERYGYYDRLINELGRKEARTRSKSKTIGPQGDYALQQVEVDHTQIDLMIYDSQGRARRPWLTVLIDRFSRMILGFYLTFEAPSWVSVMMALRMVVMPKVGYLASLDYKFTFDWDCYGTPDHLYMDRGSEFMSESLRATAQQLRIRLIDLPRASGYLKGKVERWFLSANQGLFHALPGYTGRNPSKRVEESVKPKLRMKELEVIVAAYIVDIYNSSTHSQTGEWPAKRYKESMADGIHHKWPPKAGLLGPATSHARQATLLSAVSTHGTDLGLRIKECFGLVSGRRNQDDRQILEHEKACRAGGEGHSPGDSPALFSRRQDPDRAGRPAWRRQHCRAVPQGRDRAEPVLHLVERVHGSRQAPPGR